MPTKNANHKRILLSQENYKEELCSALAIRILIRRLTFDIIGVYLSTSSYHIQNARAQHEPYKNVLLPTKPRGLQMHVLPARPTLRIRKAPSTTQSSTKRQPAHRPLQYKIHGTGCRRTHLHPLSGLVWRYASTDGGADEQRHGNADTRSRSGEGYDV